MFTRPDYGKSLSVPPDIDNAEIPPRLGSPVAFRRTGRAVYYDLFTSTATFMLNAGAGGSSVIDTSISYRGASSLRIIPGTVKTEIARFFPWTSPNTKMGIELTFGAASTIFDSVVYMLLAGCWLNNNTVATLQLDFSTGDLSYNVGAGLVLLANYSFKRYNPFVVWHNWKLIIDASSTVNDKLASVIYDTDNYAIGAALSEAGGGGHYTYVAIGATPHVNNTLPFYISDFIFTIDEP
jgi:hypothetical protein